MLCRIVFRRPFPSRLLRLVCLLFAFSRIASADEPDLEQQIRPLFQQRCGNCHGATTQKGGLRLDARAAFFRGGDSGPVVDLREPAASELLKRLRSTDPDTQMPPEGPRLPDSEIALLERWITSGANWPESDYDRAAARDRRLEHWAFQPLSHQTPPTAPG
ncbi:MAG: hypothetical protein RLZZ436_3784, partial [Planctomycetota bacterium]